MANKYIEPPASDEKGADPISFSLRPEAVDPLLREDDEAAD
jgi:hypothetical protein